MSMASSSTNGNQAEYATADYAVPELQQGGQPSSLMAPLVPTSSANHHFQAHQQFKQPFAVQTELRPTSHRATNLLLNQNHLHPQTTLIQPQQRRLSSNEHNYELIYQEVGQQQLTNNPLHHRTSSNQFNTCHPFNSMRLGNNNNNSTNANQHQR